MSLLPKWRAYSPNVDIFLLQQWSTARHAYAHSNMRSVTNQKKFISNLGSQNFVDVDMETFRLESIAALNKISLERKTLENNDLKDATLHF